VPLQYANGRDFGSEQATHTGSELAYILTHAQAEYPQQMHALPPHAGRDKSSGAGSGGEEGGGKDLHHLSAEAAAFTAAINAAGGSGQQKPKPAGET